MITTTNCTIEIIKNKLRKNKEIPATIRYFPNNLFIDFYQASVFFGLPIETIMSKNRKTTRNLNASIIIAKYLHKKYMLTETEAGYFVGGKNHSTVNYYFRQFNELTSMKGEYMPAKKRVFTQLWFDFLAYIKSPVLISSNPNHAEFVEIDKN